MRNVCAPLLILLLAPLSGCCDQSGCEAISGPITNAGIAQGFAGAVAASGEEESGSCGACPQGTGRLSFYSLDSGLFVEDDVRDVLRREAPDEDVTIEGRYELETGAGLFLVCATTSDAARCLQAEVEAGAVTTVHINDADAEPPYIEGFDASGEEITKRWTMSDVSFR